MSDKKFNLHAHLHVGTPVRFPHTDPLDNRPTESDSLEHNSELQDVTQMGQWRIVRHELPRSQIILTHPTRRWMPDLEFSE